MNWLGKKVSSMSNSRDRILKRLRQHLPEPPPESKIVLPQADGQNAAQRIELFCARMSAVRTEVRLVVREHWIEELKKLCQEKSFSNLLFSPNTPLGMEISSAWESGAPPQLISRERAIEEWKDELFFGIDAAITSSRGGIAETGTLILWPTKDEPRSYSLVPPVHIAVMDSKQLYATFTEAVAKEQWQKGMPTNLLLISGPSKSADIEQTLAYGVHGPTELIVLLIT
jgi:L-lactate dehydrogenase complex protein LldG